MVSIVDVLPLGQYCRRTAPRSVSWTCCPSVSIVDVLPLGQYRGRTAPRSVFGDGNGRLCLLREKEGTQAKVILYQW